MDIRKAGKEFLLAAYLLAQYLLFPAVADWAGNMLVPVLLLVVLVIEESLAEGYKASIVYWRRRNPYASCRAFSLIAAKDRRIDGERLKLLFPGRPVPSAPMEQNDCWSVFYEKYASVPQVLRWHRVFRVTRDFAVLNFLLIPVSLCAYLLSGARAAAAASHATVLLTAFLASAFAARKSGNKVVADVLVAAVSDIPAETGNANAQAY